MPVTMPTVLNQSVLVLNQSYEPLHVCSVRRAIVLVFRGRAEVVEACDSRIHTVSDSFPVRVWCVWPYMCVCLPSHSP